MLLKHPGCLPGASQNKEFGFFSTLAAGTETSLGMVLEGPACNCPLMMGPVNTSSGCRSEK